MVSTLSRMSGRRLTHSYSSRRLDLDRGFSSVYFEDDRSLLHRHISHRSPRSTNIVMAEAVSPEGQQPVPKLTEAHLSALKGALKSKPPYCSGVVDVAPEELVLFYGTGREAW